MDEQPKTPAAGTDPVTPPSTNNNFMDIQAPKSVPVTDGSEDADTTAAATDTIAEPAAEETAPVSVPVTSDSDTTSASSSWEPEIPASEPASALPHEESPASVVSEPSEPTPAPEPFAVSPAPSDSEPEHSQPAPADAPHKAKSGMPIGAIVAAIVIALVLAGLAVYAYSRSKNATTTKAPAASQPVAAKTPATATDVDTTNQQIDTSLAKVDDTKDFAAADLSDATLSL